MTDPNSPFSFPVVRFTVERLQQTLVYALNHAAEDINADVIKAVEQFFRDNRAEDLLAHEVAVALDKQIRAEVGRFFKYGPGHDAIRRAVEATLKPMVETTHADQQRD